VGRMVASAMMRAWPLAGGSLAGLFFCGISWVCCRAHEHGGHQC
jgi:hypothetical protein